MRKKCVLARVKNINIEYRMMNVQVRYFVLLIVILFLDPMKNFSINFSFQFVRVGEFIWI